MDPTFDTYFESKTNINKDKWTCEIYIPYSSLDLNCNSNLDKKTPFTFNVGRCYHPLKEDYGLYSYANCPDLILYDKEFFAKCEGNIDLSLFTYTDKLKINTPDKYYVGKNEFTTNSGYDFSLIDIKSGKVYDSVNKKIELNLDREPLKLYAIIKKDNVVLASSSVINVETEKFLSYDIVYPFYKSIVQSKDPNKTFKGSVIIDRNDFDLYDIIYSVKLGSKTIKSDTVSVRPNEKQEIAFGLGDLKPGEYVCEFVVKGKGQIIDKCEYPFEVCAPADFEVTFDDRNLCYVNGEPFFPIGLYHANGREIAQRNPDKQMLSEEEAIIDIKDKNFNFGASLNYIKPEDYPVYTKNGLLYCPEIGRTTDKSVIDPIIKAVNDQKTSLIYYTYDEPYGNLVNEATEAYDYINKQDKHRPIVAAVNTPEVFWYTNNTFDIFMPDVYIFTQNNKPSVTGLKGAIDTAKAASHNQKPIWMVPQAFGWGDPEMVWRVPTTEELRCQAYFSLVQGVTGLFWYAYVTGEADKTSPYGIWYIRNSDIWDYFKILNKEILDFSEILYKGKSLGSLKCDNELIFSNVWQVGDTKYAIIVNPEQSEQTATFEALPDNVTPVFDYIYNIEGKTIHFKPLECVIVRY